MAEAAPDVVVQNTAGGQSADINVSMEQQTTATAAAEQANLPTAGTLGVSDAQFAKFYNPQSGYNWQAHATEANFRASQGTDVEADVQTEAPAPVVEPASPEVAQNAISQAGLDFPTLEAQVVENGTIDDVSFKALEDIGIPRSIVSDYIESISDRATSQVAAVIDAFGGDENLNRVKAYATENYTEAEMLGFDEQLADPNQYQAVVDMLRHKAGVLPGSTGTPLAAPNALGGGMDGVQGYASDAEMQVDMRDPRYKRDAAFRQHVTSKVAASSYGGNNPRAHSGGL